MKLKKFLDNCAFFTIPFLLRYESPLGASPSRNLDHSHPFEGEMFDRSMSYRGSVGRAIGAGNSYTGKHIHSFNFYYFYLNFYLFLPKKTKNNFFESFFMENENKLAINSYRSSKPGNIHGYSKHSTLPTSIRNGYSSVSQQSVLQFRLDYGNMFFFSLNE